MSKNLIIGVLGGALFGGLLSLAVGNTVIGILICAALGAGLGYFFERKGQRGAPDGR